MKIHSLLFIPLFFISCTDKKERYDSNYFKAQKEATYLLQTGMYHFFNNQEYKKVKKLFPNHTNINSNLYFVEKFLNEASDITPYRIDIHYGIASTYILQRKWNQAFDRYKLILKLNPEEVDATIFLAMYHHASENLQEFEQYITLASRIDSNKTTYYKNSIKQIEKVNSLKFNTIPKKKFPDKEHVIIVLGYALTPDGELTEILTKRLEKTLELALLYPESKIIVSGSVPKQGKTEAFVMKEWLIKKGIPQKNIIIEQQATDTISNSSYSLEILKTLHNPKYATLITSASHMRRSLNIFIEMSKVKNINIEWDNLVYMDYHSLDEAYNITHTEKMTIYRDFLRASGLWLFPGFHQ